MTQKWSKTVGFARRVWILPHQLLPKVFQYCKMLVARESIPGSFALRWTNEWTDGWKISPFYKTPSPIRVAAKKEMKTTLAILSIFILFFSLTIDTTLINIANVYIAFLLVVTQLYKRVCLLVCGSIRWSILHACFSVCKKRAKLAKMRSVMTRQEEIRIVIKIAEEESTHNGLKQPFFPIL